MISNKLAKAMNEQARNEIASAYLYLSMSAWFQSRSLEGMAHWMRAQAHEEMIHSMKFLDHILDRGGEVILLDIPKPKPKWSSPLEAWKDTSKHEAGITSKINELIGIARKEQEYSSEPLLAWFLKEQVEEEATVGKIVQQIAMSGENQGLLLLDRELAVRPFPPGSPLDPVAYNLPAAP